MRTSDRVHLCNRITEKDCVGREGRRGKDGVINPCYQKVPRNKGFFTTFVSKGNLGLVVDRLMGYDVKSLCRFGFTMTLFSQDFPFCRSLS